MVRIVYSESVAKEKTKGKREKDEVSRRSKNFCPDIQGQNDDRALLSFFHLSMEQLEWEGKNAHTNTGWLRNYRKMKKHFGCPFSSGVRLIENGNRFLALLL